MKTAKQQTIKLLKSEIEAPAFAAVLNPNLEGEAKYAYYVWPFDPQAITIPTLQEIASKKAAGTLFVFLTNYEDFYKTGRHDTLVLRSHLESLKDESHELLRLMFAQWRNTPFADKPMAWAFSLAGKPGPQPVGTSYGFANENGRLFIMDTADEARAYGFRRMTQL